MKVSFTNDFKKKSVERFEKLRVEKGDTDRVGIVTAPERFYVHQLNMPVVLDGEIVQETLKNAKGEEYDRDKLEFVGAYLCQGDETVLSESLDGFDAANCALCAAIKEHGDQKFRRPEPRYACYVVRYALDAHDEPKLDPFQVELKLWVFSQNRFENIIRIANEHGDPMKLDLLLGPCKNTTFQAYEIAAGGKCYWLAESDRKKHVAALAKSEGVGTPENDEVVKNTVARQFSANQAEMDIAKILERWSLVGKTGSSNTALDMDFGGAVASSQKADSEEGGWSFDKKEESKPPAFADDDSDDEDSSDDSDDDGPQDFESLLASLG